MSNLQTKQRPDGLTVLSIWFYLSGAFYMLTTAVVVFLILAFLVGPVRQDAEMLIPTAVVALIALAFMAMSILNIVVGYGLWILKPWARIGAIALAIVSLIFVPIGTTAGALTLWYLLKPEIAASFDKSAT
jgi:hypothetical protein